MNALLVTVKTRRCAVAIYRASTKCHQDVVRTFVASRTFRITDTSLPLDPSERPADSLSVEASTLSGVLNTARHDSDMHRYSQPASSSSARRPWMYSYRLVDPQKGVGKEFSLARPSLPALLSLGMEYEAAVRLRCP